MLTQNYGNQGILGGGTQKKRWDADVAWFELKPNTPTGIRLVGPIWMVAHNWFTTTKQKNFSLISRSWDPVKREFTEELKAADPIFQFFGNPYDHQDERIKKLAPRLSAYAQAFIRTQPGNTNSGTLMPVRLPISLISAIRKACIMNYQVDYSVNPPQYVVDASGQYVVAEPADVEQGCDFVIVYDPKEAGAARYSAQFASKSPLRESERAQLNQLIDWQSKIEVPTEAEVKESLMRNGYMALATNNSPAVQMAQSYGGMADIGSATTVAPTVAAPAPAPMAAPAPAAPMAAPAPLAPAAPAPLAPPMAAPAAPAQMAAPLAPPAPAAPLTPPAPMSPPAGPGLGFPKI